MARGHVRCWAPSSSHSKMPTPAEKTLNMNLLQAHPLHGSLLFQFTSCLSNVWRCYDCLNIFGTFFCNKKIKKSPKISPITSLRRPSSRGRRLVSFALGEGLPRSQRASSRPSSTNWSSVYRVSRCASLAQGLGGLGSLNLPCTLGPIILKTHSIATRKVFSWATPSGWNLPGHAPPLAVPDTLEEQKVSPLSLAIDAIAWNEYRSRVVEKTFGCCCLFNGGSVWILSPVSHPILVDHTLPSCWNESMIINVQWASTGYGVYGVRHLAKPQHQHQHH